MNLLEQFKNYLFSQEIKPSKVTVKNYSSDINHFVKWFEKQYGAILTSPITNTILQQYQASFEKTLSPASMQRHLSSLRKFFKYLKAEGKMIIDPFEESVINGKDDKDVWKLKDFKNNLFVNNAAHLTIKNYIIDVKQFVLWAKEVTGLEDNLLVNRLDKDFVEEYKKRLIEVGEFSPATVNRKLSSLRKYLSFAQGNGLLTQNLTSVENINEAKQKLYIPSIENITGDHLDLTNLSNKYSKFPPLRLIQKFSQVGSLGFDSIFIAPLVKIASKIQYATWKLRGQPIFTKGPQTLITKNITPQDLLGIKNISKSIYAPFKLSKESFTPLQKLIFQLRYTRPNWYKRYHSYAITHYFHFAVLVIFLAAVGFGIYNSFFIKPSNQNPALAALPTAPPRILSFQGRLTDNNDNPITTANTLIRFAIYNNLSASGAALLWQEVDSVNPDVDGIFNSILGNISAIPSTLFSENAALYLGVTIEATPELTPRQQLATVAYATNSETLQGLLPITGVGASTSNVVLALDSSGNLTIGGSANPIFSASGGQFKLSGQPLLLTTNTGTDANVQITTDDLGKIDLQKPILNSTNSNNITTAIGAVEVNDLFAVLATSSGQSAVTINQTSTGPIISASVGGTAKFTIDNSGNEDLAGNLTAAGTTGISLSGNGAGITFSGTGNHDISASSGTLRLGALTLTGAVTGNSQSVTGLNNLSAAGTVTFSNFNANNNVLYATVSTGVLAGASTDSTGLCLVSGASAPTWGSCGSSSGSLWRIVLGAISPVNDTLDLLIGSNATTSAKFAVLNVNSGTPVASVSSGLSGTSAYLTADGTLATQNRMSLTIGNSSTYNTTGNVLINPNGTGNVGIGTTSPTALLDVAGTASVGGVLKFRSGTAQVQSTVNQLLTIGGDTTGNIVLAPLNSAGTVFGGTAANGDLTLEGTSNATKTTSYINLQPNGGNVGIGSTGPLNKLDVNGNLGILGSNGLRLYNTANNAFATFAYNNSTNVVDENYTLNLTLATTSLTTAGSVGIGTTTPTALLDVAGTASVGGQFKFRSGTAQIQSTANQTLTLGGDTTGNINLNPNNSSGGIITANGALTVAGTTTLNGVANIGDNGDNVVINSNIWDITGAGVASGLTGLSSSGTITFSNFNANNNVMYATVTTGVLAGVNTSTQNLCLVSGATVPTWATCASGQSNDVLWSQTSGLLYPNNSTVDFAIGGQATTSAKFAVLNINSDTPIASVSSGLSGTSAFLTADGTLATQNRMSLTIGNSSTYNTTGNVLINPNGTGNVGIGTTAPVTSLTLDVPNVAIGDGWGNLVIRSTDSFAINKGGSLVFAAKYNTAGSQADIAGVYGRKENATDGNFAGYLQFGTRAAAGSITEKMRITSGGNVGINDTSPDAFLEVLGTTEQLRLTHTDGTIDARFTLDSSGNLTIDASTDGTGSETLTLTGFSTLTASSLITLSLGTSATINAGATALNLQADGTPDVNIAGGNSLTGCTIANSTGNLTCSGTITGTGAVGYWTKSVGNIYPATTNDTLSATSAASTVATFTSSNPAGTLTQNTLINNTGAGTVTSLLQLTQTAGTVTNGLSLSGTIGTDINLQNGETISNASNGTIALGTTTLTLTGTTTLTASSLTSMTTGAAFTIDGTSYVKIGDGATTPGSATTDDDLFVLGDLEVDGVFYADGGIDTTFTSDGGVLYTNASGVIAQATAGSSSQCLLGGTTPSFGNCASGPDAIWQQTNGAIFPNNSTVDTLLGGQASTSAVFKATGQGNPFAGTLVGASVSANTSFAGLVADQRGVGDIFTASRSGTTRFVIANDGSITQNSLSTSQNSYTLNANSLTTGTGFSLLSTSTALSTGGLMSLYWNPGSATTATGDLLSLDVGTNGTLANIFNVKNAGSSVFSVSQTAVTSNLPTAFTAAGDVSIAYDINFTNPTASYIKSAAPLYFEAGESFGSSDLTLRTFNKGNIIADTEAFSVTGSATVSGTIQGQKFVDIDNTVYFLDPAASGTSLTTAGSVGIGTTTIPKGAIGDAKFAIDGTASSNTAGPHVQYTVSSDNYPIWQQLNWTHDNIAQSFDAYYSSGWKSGTTAGGQFQLYKLSGALQFNYANINTQGNAVTWTTALSIANTGGITATSAITANGGIICTDCIALTSETSGAYVASITAGNGLTGDVSTEGSTPTLAVGAGTCITLAADSVGVTSNCTDAGTLDSIDSTQFAQSKVFASTDFNSETGYSGVSSINGVTNTPFGAAWYNLDNNRHRGGISDGNVWGSQIATGMTGFTNRMAMRVNTGTAGVWTAWNEIWTAGSDGSGSGLDADSVDGINLGGEAFATNRINGRVRMADVGCAGSWASSCDIGSSGFVDTADTANAVSFNSGLTTGSGPTFDTVYTGNWFRSSGNSGWYNSTYTTGVYATTANRVDIYNGGGLYVPGTLNLGGVVSCIQGNCPTNSAIRLTPNLHLNASAGYAVIVNWDGGTTGTSQTFRIGNGASADIFYVLANGNTRVSGNMTVGSTAAPASTLDVEGTLQFNTSSGDSQRLCHNQPDGGGGAQTNLVARDCNSGGADFAEYAILNIGSAEPGDVVYTIGNNPTDNTKILKGLSNSAYQPNISGIISTNPFVDVIADDYKKLTNARPIALAGRVPVKVTTQNGNIKIGDPLVASSIPGVAMKGTKAGFIIGYAEEDYDGSVRVTPNVLDQERIWNSDTDGMPTYDSDPSKWESSVGKIITTIRPGFHDPDVMLTSTGNLNIMDNTPNLDFNTPHIYVLNDPFGLPIDRVGIFADLISSKIRAGFISAKQISTNSLTIASSNVSIAGLSLYDYISAIVNEQITNISNFTSNNIVSPIASIDTLKTGFISPIAEGSSIGIRVEKDKIEIVNGGSATNSAVASFDNTGNATFSGILSSRALEVSDDASISGTLRARRIIADQIEGLNIKASTLSANYITNVTNVYNSSSSAFPTLSASPSGQTQYAFDNSGYINIATFSSQLAFVENLNSVSGVFSQNLSVFGNTTLSDTSVIGQLAIGGSLILADNSINVLGSDLSLQPLRQGGISIMAGLIYIDTNGNVKFGNDATVNGTLYANQIAPIPGKDLTFKLSPNSAVKNKLVVKGASDSAILSIDNLGNLIASGAGSFAKLNINSIVAPALAVSPTEMTATGSAGTAQINPNRVEMTINNPLVTENSLIYITPTSNTQNQVLYLLRQVAGESFTVGIENPLSVAIPFNWIIVN